MAEDPNTALLQTILSSLQDLRDRVGRVETLMDSVVTSSSEQGVQISTLVNDVNQIEKRLDQWIEKTEPVTKAYADVPKVLRGVIATCSVVAVVMTAWWSGAIASVVRFLQQPPVAP